MTHKKELVLKGIWYYSETELKPIEIIKQNWDFYHEEGYDEEAPDLNEKGEVYYVLFDSYDDIRYANRSQSCLSLEEAIILAKEKVNGNITWLGTEIV